MWLAGWLAWLTRWLVGSPNSTHQRVPRFHTTEHHSPVHLCTYARIAQTHNIRCTLYIYIVFIIIRFSATRHKAVHMRQQHNMLAHFYGQNRWEQCLKVLKVLTVHIKIITLCFYEFNVCLCLWSTCLCFLVTGTTNHTQTHNNNEKKRKQQKLTRYRQNAREITTNKN